MPYILKIKVHTEKKGNMHVFAVLMIRSYYELIEIYLNDYILFVFNTNFNNALKTINVVVLETENQ